MKLNEIRQDNAITLARYDYTSLEINLLVLIFEQVNKYGNSDYTELEIDLKILYNQTNFDRSHMSRIRDALKSIRSKFFEFYDKEERVYMNIIILSSFKIYEAKDKIVFNVDPFIKPLLCDITKNTTRYYRESIMKIPGKNSKRIYHICSQWKSKGGFKMDIDRLKSRLSIDENKYADSISMFKKTVLDVAKREITEFSELDVDYTLIKEGKRFIEVQFTVKIKNGIIDQVIENNTSDPKIEKLFVILTTEFTLSKFIAKAAIEFFETEKLYKIIYDTRLKKNLQNKGAYLYQIFINLGLKNTKENE